MTRLTEKESRPHNSTYKKLAVQWLKEALCFVSSSVVADSFRLRNRQLLVAAKRYAQRPAEGRMISVTQVRARFQVREIITVPERWAAFDDAVFVGKVRVGVPPLMPDSIRVPLGMKCFHPGKEYCHDSAA